MKHKQLRAIALTLALTPSLALAQTIVNSNGITAEEIFGQSSSAGSNVLWAFGFFVVSLLSFLYFWFNRHYIAEFFGAAKPNLEVDFDNLRENTQKQKMRLDPDDNLNQEPSEQIKTEFEKRIDESAVHDVVLESEEEYKKPKLKIIMDNGEPKLVFE